MQVTAAKIPGVVVLTPKLFSDDRGFFFEAWNHGRYDEAGIRTTFVQDNVSRSRRGTLRGLHFQHPDAQGKLAMVLEGEVFDVAVDVRRDSPTFGKWHGEFLSSTNKNQMYVPPGFAHGFIALSETAIFLYKCTTYYSPEQELTLRWDDPDVGIEWPIMNPILSPKDQKGLFLRDLPPDRLFPNQTL